MARLNGKVAAADEPAVWRLVILFIGTNGIGLVISTWLIQYLVGHGGDTLGSSTDEHRRFPRR